MAERYMHPETLEPVSADELRTLPPEEQKAIARGWFYRHFEDPAEKTPYESREGGYIWIWGGPYDAAEELHDQFHGVIPDGVLENLAEELAGESPLWAPGPEHPTMADAYVDVLASSPPLRSFQSRMGTLEDLVAVSYPEELENAQYQLLLAAGVSALEAYLAERAVRGVQQHDHVLRGFIESHSKFREYKVPVSQVPKMAAGLERYATDFLSRVVWHRLGEARRIFEDAFGIDDFPEVEGLDDVISMRHDIVHRAGLREDGTQVEVTAEELLEYLRLIETFIGRLEPQLPLDDDAESAIVPGWPVTSGEG